MQFGGLRSPTGFLPCLDSRMLPCRAVCILFRLFGRLCMSCPGRMIYAGLRLCGRVCVICLNRVICAVFCRCRRSCAGRLGRASYFTRGLCRGLTFCQVGGFRFVLTVDQRFLHRGRGLRTFRGPCLGHCLGAGRLLLQFGGLHDPVGFLPSLDSRMSSCRAVCILFRLHGRWCVICLNRAICVVFCLCRRSCVGRLVRMGGFARGLCGGLMICRAGGFCFVLAVDQRFLHRGLRTFCGQSPGHCLGAGCLFLRRGGLHRPMGFLLLQFGNLHSFVRFLILQFKGPHDPAGFLPSLDSRMPPCRAVCILFRLCGRLLVSCPGRMICAGLRLCGKVCIICLNRAICVVFRLYRRSCAGCLGRTDCFTQGLCGSLMICRASVFGFRLVLAVDQRFLHRSRSLRTFRGPCLGHCIGAGCLFLRFKALHRPTGFLPLQFGNLHSFVGFPLLQCRGLRSLRAFLGPCLPLFLCRSSATLHPARLARIPGVGGWLGAGSTGWMRALFCVLTVVR